MRLTHSKPKGSAWSKPGDPLGFNTGPADPVNPEGVPVNLTLQLTRRESLISSLRQNKPILARQFQCVASTAAKRENN